MEEETFLLATDAERGFEHDIGFGDEDTGTSGIRKREIFAKVYTATAADVAPNP